MPFDGTGNYSPPSPPTFPAVNGEVIRSDYFNAIITDIANSLTLTFTKDGQSAPTAELDFNAQNLTNIDALDAISVDALNYFINGDLLDYSAFGQDWISSADAAEARGKLGLSAGNDSGLISGGQVFWESGYTFRIAAATYTINGVYYTSAEQTVTLTASDLTNDRIDVIYLDSAGLAGAITGTAAALPTEPDIEVATQIKLTFVFVEAASAAPGTVTNTNIYLENAEWTSSTSGSGFNAASTNNPYSGTTCIEGTSVANNAYVSLQAGAPFTLDSATNLSMFIRSKATWASGRVLRVQWYLNGVAKGIPLTIASGYWGFNSSTLAYQLVSIPIAQFVLPVGTSVNQLRITDNGGSIGFYIDNIVLQAQGTDLNQNVEDYLTQGEADARYIPLTYLDTDTTLAANSDTKIATQKAVKAYVDANAGGYTDEQVRDVIASTLVPGAGIAVSVDDAGDTITIASTESISPGVTVPVVSQFSWVNQGTATATDTVQGIYVTNDNDQEVHMLVQTAPSTPFDVYLELDRAHLDLSASADIFTQFGLVLRDGTNQDFLFAFFMDRRPAANGVDNTVRLSRWTNATTNSADVTAVTTYTTPTKFPWMRANVTSTTVTLYVSLDGRNWIQYASETIATFVGSITQVGIGFRSGTNNDTSIALVKSFGFTAPT